MARLKTVSEEEVLDAAVTVLSKAGPAGLTLAAVGAISGLSPATLVQRYGTREALMRAALLRMWDGLDEATVRADLRRPVSAAGAIGLLVGLSGSHGGGGEDSDIAQGLLLLREDFRDPALRARGAAWGEALAKALGRRLSEDPGRGLELGRLMASQWQGCVIWWGFCRRGSLRTYVKQELSSWCRVVLGETG
jgi:AcrR family transcriptional regulator